MEVNKPFKDTKLGQFLSEKAPHILNAVGDILPNQGTLGILKNIISKDPSVADEDKAQIQKLVEEQQTELISFELQEMSSARAREVSINQADQSSWLAKNTASIIALSYTLFNFIILAGILFGQIKVGENMAILIVNSVVNICMLVVGYYFGASHSQMKMNQQQMRVMQDDKDNKAAA